MSQLVFTFDIVESEGVLLQPSPGAAVCPDLPAGGEEGGVAAGGGRLAGVPQPGVSVAHQAADQPAEAGRAVVDVVLPSVLLVDRPAHRQRSSYVTM